MTVANQVVLFLAIGILGKGMNAPPCTTMITLVAARVEAWMVLEGSFFNRRTRKDGLILWNLGRVQG